MFQTLALAASLASGWLGVLALPHASASPANQQENAPAQGSRPARNQQASPSPAPISILASGNRLMVMSDDPEALKLAQELVRLLTHSSSGPGDFEIIRLKNANAVETASVLDELYNGRRRQGPAAQLGRANPFAGPESGPAAGMPASAREDRIRVVADPATNALLVRANVLDLLSIRRLLEKTLDVGNSDSSAIRRTWLLPPLQYANAPEVAQVLRAAYGESANRQPRSATTGGFANPGLPGMASAESLGDEASSTGRTTRLSIGVDERSNRLVLGCTEKLKDEVKSVVDQLDNAAKNATRTVRVVQIKGVDPVLVQQAIDAIQGRSISVPRNNGNGMPEFGQPRMGSFGSNGFPQGMFGTGGFGPGAFQPLLPAGGVPAGGYRPPAPAGGVPAGGFQPPAPAGGAPANGTGGSGR